jgi:hypothetical protein
VAVEKGLSGIGSMERNYSSFYHASATTPRANHGDFFNTHAWFRQLKNHAEAGNEILVSDSTSSPFGAQVPSAHLATAASPHVP